MEEKTVAPQGEEKNAASKGRQTAAKQMRKRIQTPHGSRERKGM